jgi:hypothetical protein
MPPFFDPTTCPHLFYKFLKPMAGFSLTDDQIIAFAGKKGRVRSDSVNRYLIWFTHWLDVKTRRKVGLCYLRMCDKTYSWVMVTISGSLCPYLDDKNALYEFNDLPYRERDEEFWARHLELRGFGNLRFVTGLQEFGVCGHDE